MILLNITPHVGCEIPVTEKTIYVTEEQLLRIGFSERNVSRVTDEWDINYISHRDANFTYKATPDFNKVKLTQSQKNEYNRVVELLCFQSSARNSSSIKFVGLHAHSGVGSPFDGFGYPQAHMDFCYENGGQALALTDHGNMNGFAYQILHANKMAKEGKDFKPIFGAI